MHWLIQRVGDFSPARRGGGHWLLDIRSTYDEPSFECNQADIHIHHRLDSDTKPSPQSIREEKLIRVPIFPVAAPAFVAGLKAPIQTFRDIANLPRIQDSSPSEWSAWFGNLGLDITKLPPPCACYDHANSVVAAARAGQGLALANYFTVADDLASGQLVRVQTQNGPVHEATFGTYIFRCARIRWNDVVISKFRRWLTNEIKDDPAIR